MEDIFEQLYAADPEFAEWVLYQEDSFGQSLAQGYLDLVTKADSEQIRTYRRQVRKAAKNGPTLGRMMATYLVPVLRFGTNGFLEHFLMTRDVMLTKGTYTLKSPFDALASLLESGDSASGAPYLDLLSDIFSQEMSYNQSLHLVHSVPKSVLSFSRPKRPWQIRELGRVIREDFRLCDYFLDGMEKGLHLLSRNALEEFVTLGLEKFRGDSRLGEKFLSLNSKLGVDTYTDMLVSVSLSQVRHQLNRYLRARTGLPLSIRALSVLQRSGVWGLGSGASESRRTNHPEPRTPNLELTVRSDGRFIYLPDEINFFDDKARNAELCKCLAKLESAYYEFGTFDFDLEKVGLGAGFWVLGTGFWGLVGEQILGGGLNEKNGDQSVTGDKQPATRNQQAETRNQKPETRNQHSDLQRLFTLFPEKALASDLFTIFEHGRLRLKLNRFYPGILRQALPLLRDEALRMRRTPPLIPPQGGNGNAHLEEVLFLLYEKIALGVSKKEFSQVSEKGRAAIDAVSELFDKKINEESAVEACAELLFEAYGKLEGFGDFSRDNTPPCAPLKGGILNTPLEGGISNRDSGDASFYDGGAQNKSPLERDGTQGESPLEGGEAQTKSSLEGGEVQTKSPLEGGAGGCHFHYHPLKTPFDRKVRPDLFFSAFGHFERMAEKIKSGLEKKRIRVYKSDIRTHLIRNNGEISANTLRDMALSRTRDSGHADENANVSLALVGDVLNEFSLSNSRSPFEEASGPVSWYGEWDCHLGDYLGNHVRVVDRVLAGPEGDFYSRTLKRHEGLVRQIRHAFELLKPEGLVLLRQWTEGDEFDYRALLDFAMDKKAGITPSDRLYIKRMKQQRDVAVLLLTDLSRSTRNLVPGTPYSVLDVEKEAIVLFCEALRVVGDAFAIAGFSGTGRLGVDYFRIKDFGEPLNETVRGRISAMSPQRNTRMGGAVRHAIRQLGQAAAKIRLLIILGDGFPNDTDYKQTYAMEDTRKAIFEARSKNIHARAITVNLAADARLDSLYGSLRHSVISDVRELPDKLLRIYGALTR